MFGKWREKRKKRHERNGFAFAMTSLLYDKTETIESLQAKISEAKDFGEFNDFDNGIVLALSNITVLNKV
jgi:hypothetical protein